MDAVRQAWRGWSWFGGVVVRAALALLLGCVSMLAGAQTSSFGLNAVVCGPAGASGVTYVTVGGAAVVCGTDASGNALALQVDQAVSVIGVSGDPGNGVPVGAEIGGAVLGVMAVAYAFRVVRNFINSSSEG
jgi:hypothetical protein